MWAAIAGLSLLALVALPSALLPPFYYLAVAAAYALILPALAVLHIRHARVRESGAILATIAGTATVVMGMVTAADPVNGTAALFVRGVWWWTVGKMWWETSVLPRPFGIVTMVLAPLAIAGGLYPTFTQTWIDAALAVWMLALAFVLARAR